jgi:hypothetical protein
MSTIYEAPCCAASSLSFSLNSLLRILFSNTHSLCSSFSVTDHVSYPYKTTDNCGLYTLTFTFVDSRRDRMVTSILRIKSVLNLDHIIIFDEKSKFVSTFHLSPNIPHNIFHINCSPEGERDQLLHPQKSQVKL